jgi:hypothetical protein
VFAASLDCGRAVRQLPKCAAYLKHRFRVVWRTVQKSARSDDAGAEEHGVSEHSDDRTDGLDLLPVRARVRPRAGRPAGGADDPGIEATESVATPVGWHPRIGGRAIATVVAILGVAFVDPFGGAALAIATVGIVIFRRSQAAERYGFGDGFLPFRRELPWPRGVQEDDDFRYNWSGSSRAAG